MSLNVMVLPGMGEREAEATAPILRAGVLHREIRGLEERVARAAPCEVRGREANPPIALLHKVEQLSRTTVTA